MAQETKQTQNTVIVHDWLVGGGAEQVILQLHKVYPDAPIYTSYCTDEWRERLDGAVRTGYLQHLGKFRKFLPLLQYFWFRSIDLNEYDVVLVTTGNGMAKAVRPPKTSTFICYCHTPVHYLWRHYETYMQRTGFGIFSPVARLGLRILAGPLRKLDYAAAQRPDYFIGNSTHIAKDIKQYYGRDATVIFPPVDTTRFSGKRAKGKGFVTVGRLVPMKRNDIAVEACNLLGARLTIIGSGPDYDNLKHMAGPTVRVTGRLTDAEVEHELANASAFLFASYEDFGVAPVEAMAAGLPVIAFKKAGALDYVIPGVTGEFFDQQDVKSLVETLQSFSASKYDPKVIRKFADRFSVDQFQQSIKAFVSERTNS